MPKNSKCFLEDEGLVLEVFAADERADLAALYLAGQAESLREHVGTGLRAVPLGDAQVVLARDGEGRAHGGMRVHLRRPGVPLPVELALGERCAIAEAVARAPAPLVELCGTWIGERHRGTALALVIARAAIEVAQSLGSRRIVGCGHQYVMPFYCRFGAVVDAGLGVHAYPDARYETRVFWADPEFCAGKLSEVEGIRSFVCGARIFMIGEVSENRGGGEIREMSRSYRVDRGWQEVRA